MKHTFFSVMIFLFLLVSCNQTPKNQQNKSSSNNCYPIDSRPSQAITYKEMAAMMESFDKGAKIVLDNYMKEISDGKDSISTVYNWYKIEVLKQYIAYIERISKEKNIPLTGFRIYPSSYPLNYSDEKLRGRQTLIFTPTTSINGKNDVAFEPLYSEIGKPILVSKFLELEKKKKITNGSFLKSTDTTTIQSSSSNRLPTSPPN